MGPLAEAVFSRICSIGGNVKGGFTAEALKDYAAQAGRKVTTQEVQGVIGLMTAADLLMRVSHGHYGVTDAFVEKAWVARLREDNLLRPDAPTKKEQLMTIKSRAQCIQPDISPGPGRSLRWCDCSGLICADTSIGGKLHHQRENQ